ncbi:MAG: hypothetical protein IT373_18865, partial [Polyangiaceae bacterium]|nr:hypothetical protein [Polyangiaceae bacterium]
TTGGGGSGNEGGQFVPPPPVNTAPCGNQTYDCGDLVDNDSDGLVDYQDPDCLGPCDNTEDTYYTDLPGQAGGACVSDCFWENGNGSGTDQCYWDWRCDVLAPEPGCPYEQDQMVGSFDCQQFFTTQSQTCHDVCAPIAPNGCDCFGCCELPAGSGEHVWLGVPTCNLGSLDDPAACPPCTPVPGCDNPCEPCELCLGETELPPGCTPEEQCPPELTPCGLEGQDPCPAGSYCLTGCCIVIPN